MPSKQIGLKKCFCTKIFFFSNLLFFQSQSCLLESTAAIFRQSAGYVLDIIDNWKTIRSSTFNELGLERLRTKLYIFMRCLNCFLPRPLLPSNFHLHFTPPPMIYSNLKLYNLNPLIVFKEFSCIFFRYYR